MLTIPEKIVNVRFIINLHYNLVNINFSSRQLLFKLYCPSHFIQSNKGCMIQRISIKLNRRFRIRRILRSAQETNLNRENYFMNLLKFSNFTF